MLLGYLHEAAIDPRSPASRPRRDRAGRSSERWARARRCASSRCRSTTRCGSSTPRARPGCRRRSCTATAASCSSSSRRNLHLDLRPRRPHVLVHDDRLDDVELPRRLPAQPRPRSCSTTAARASRPRRAVGARRAGRDHAAWASAPACSRRCKKAGVEPGARLRPAQRCARSARPARRCRPRASSWVYEHVKPDIWLFSTSGGTDVCTAFVAGCPLLPVYAGELQCRALGCAVEAWDEHGQQPDRRGGRARDDRADALDAAVPLGRRRRRSATARATSRCTRASGATATGSASRRAAARSSTAARTRRSTAAACAWARARSTAPRRRAARCSTRSSSTCPRGGGRWLDGAVRRPARRA